MTALGAARFGFVAAALLAGCSSFTPQPGPAANTDGQYRPLTRPFVAVGDTQEHLATGFPMHDNDSAVDAFVEVAQRPPEQILFGRRLLEWALSSHPGEPFIHLGDVMDLSCRVEAQRMAQIFQASANPGAILPGNHDGLMFGIYAHSLLNAQLDPEARKWNQACMRGTEPGDKTHKTANEALTKRDFIAHYIAGQIQHPPHKPGLVAPPLQGEHTLSWQSTDPAAFVSAVEAELIDGTAYANSFLTQRIKLPRAPGATRDTYIIALDTNQAGVLVSTWDTLMGRSPGSMGHVHPDQIRTVNKWVEAAITQGDVLIFAGHHNWQSLGLPTRIQLRELMGRLNHPLVYLSAHTHRGFWAEHRALAHRPLLEMNVSSLSDWPIAYRRISFAYDESANRLRVRAELMPQGEHPSTSDADLLAAWKKLTCEVSGVPLERIEQEDLILVKRQRDSRGSLMEWLLEALGPACETCEQPLYDHAQAYQDELIDELIEVGDNLGRDAHQLHELQLPAWCDGQDYAACGRMLQAQRTQTFQDSVRLFRRKAALVALLNDHLDDLKSPHARAYMTCRAAIAAKLDFDHTPDDKNSNRGEAKRQSEQFFRIEASVGME